jgi:hypothetical protein
MRWWKRRRKAARLSWSMPTDAKPPYGRWYAQGPSAQRVPGPVRRLCQHQYYHDVDQVNSSPIVIWNLARQLGLQVPVLTHYLTQRVACLQRV